MTALKKTVFLQHKYLSQSTSIVKIEKSPSDFVTNFDLAIQFLLESEIKAQYPYIKFIGEENKDTYFDRSLLDDLPSFVPNISLPSITNDRDLDVSKLALFIDPIDSTSSLISGDFKSVSNMIGINYEGTPLIGMINFVKFNSNSQRCFFNIPSKGVFRINFEENKVERQEQGKTKGIIYRTARKDKLIELLVEKIKYESQEVSGAGTKCVKSVCEGGLMLLNGKLGPWDYCAGHALLKETGGDLIRLDGESICYEGESKNTKYVIGSSSKEVLDSVKTYF